jgi:hypothetical protein
MPRDDSLLDASGERSTVMTGSRSTTRSMSKTLHGKKEPSLPRNWPNSTEVDLQAKPSRIISVGEEQDYLFKNNFVKTSKYEIYNFLFKFLFEEFNPKTKIANCSSNIEH